MRVGGPVLIHVYVRAYLGQHGPEEHWASSLQASEHVVVDGVVQCKNIAFTLGLMDAVGGPSSSTTKHIRGTRALRLVCGVLWPGPDRSVCGSDVRSGHAV